MFKAFFKRRRLKKAFEPHFSPDSARQLADGIFTERILRHTERSLEVVFIAISAADARGYSERAGAIADFAGQHEGIVQSIIPVVVIVFGALQPAPSGARLRFVKSVQEKFSDAAALVHGQIDASVGSYGGANRLEFGFWWSGSLDALGQLAALSPGDVKEIQSGGTKRLTL